MQKHLGFLTLSYTVVILLSNWFDPRLIHIFGLNTDAGTLLFPFSFLLSDLITEVYGFKNARRAIWYGFLFNLFFIAYGQLIIHMPSPEYAVHNKQFDQFFALDMRIIAASCVSYLFAEPVNSFIMSKLKIKTNGRYLSLRFVTSTFAASAIDSTIFTLIAFYHTMSNTNLILFLLSMWFLKVVIEVIGLPFSISFVKKLKTVEQMDIYDRKTDFNFFRLDTSYAKQANEFKK